MSYNWSDLEDIFQESLSKPKNERISFIKDKTDGNKALEETLLLMLKDSEKAEEYFYDLQETIARGIDPSEQKLYEEDHIIGKFRIKKLLGKGGMGTVYLGERADGEFEQTVAIKCLTAKAATESFLKHFKQEQQILAKLKHPSIAQLFDGGITEDGTRYIIMELIEGKPIDEYVNEKQLSEKQIIKYFITIAQAVQAAHSQLVLHQDIKPGNILVDNNGSVKLLDFGIAQVISESSPSTEAFKGTPHYAAPEQVKNETISTATDIYQLGTLLHKLVTKRLPFSKISESGVKNIAIAHEQLNWELSSIIEKCLQANPEDRYQAVTELIDDLSNYLTDYPVSTLTLTFGYRAKKYFHRNRLVASLLILIFLSMAGGTIISLRQAEIAKENQKQAYKQRDRAKKISAFLTDFFKSTDPRDSEALGKDFTVKEFLRKGIDKTESELDSLPEMKIEILGIISDMYNNLGYQAEGLQLELKLLSQYRSIYGDSSDRYFDSKVRIARMYSETGKTNEADSIYRDILNDNFGGKYINKANALTEYGLFAQNLEGNFQKADSLLNESLSIFQTHNDTLNKQYVDALSILGTLNNRLGNLKSASSFYQRELAIKKQIIKDDPVDIALTKANLATVLLKNQQLQEALKMQEEALGTLEKQLGEKHIHYLHSLNNLSHIYLSLYDYTNAKNAATKCLGLYKEKFANTSYETGYIYLNYIIFDIIDNNLDQAISKANYAESIFSKTLPETHYLNAFVYLNKAWINIKINEENSALELLNKAETLLAPSIPKSHSLWGILHYRKAMVYLKKDRQTLAEHFLLKSYENLLNSKGLQYHITQAAIISLAKLYEKTGSAQKAKEFSNQIEKDFTKSKLVEITTI